VKTKELSSHRGKIYFLRCETPEEAELWIQKATLARVSYLYACTPTRSCLRPSVSRQLVCDLWNCPHLPGRYPQDKAKHSLSRRVSKERVQRQLRRIHDHKIFQTAVAILILANFVSSVVQLQIKLDKHNARVFDALDVAFTIIFLLELLLNMATHWFLEFW